MDFIIGVKFVIDTDWVTVAGLGFIFNRLGLDIVISILSIEGVGIGVSSTSTLVLWSSLCITLINYWCWAFSIAYYCAKASIKDCCIIVIYSLTRAIIVDVADLSSFAISRVVVLTQHNIRARRDFKVNLKEWYKFYLDLRV